MRQWALLTALGVVGLLAVGWFLLVSPKKASAASARTATAATLAQVTQLQVQAAALRGQSRLAPSYRARTAAVGVHMPAVPDLPTLVRWLSQSANSTGMTLNTITPGSAAPDTTPLGRVSATVAAPAAAPTGYQVIPVSLTVTGSFSQTERFLTALESGRRTFLVSAVTSAPHKAATSDGSSSGGLDSTISGRVFVSGTAPTPGVTGASPGRTGTTSITGTTGATATPSGKSS